LNYVEYEKNNCLGPHNKMDLVMNTLTIELVRSWANEYGDAFYILDTDAFRRNYQELLGEFTRIYNKTSLAYSYKTNYIPKLCKMVNLLGGYAEVVSRMEYDLAVEIGVPPNKIIFNGPYKKMEDLERALLAGALVNLDSSYELEYIRTIAKKSPTKKLKVGLRCNFDIGEKKVSRFGFDVEGGEFTNIIDELKSIKNCIICGIHCHFSTSHRSVESYIRRTRSMLEIANAYFNRDQLRYINIGGGFFGKLSLSLKKQFNNPAPSYRDYANSIADQFARRFEKGDRPKLILEPGTAVAADTMYFVCKVIELKTIRSREVALVTGNIYNIKPTLNDINLPIRVLSSEAFETDSKKTVDIVGTTCKEDDCLYKGFKGILSHGDYIVFSNVGAYTIVLNPPFIHPCPPVLEYDAGTEKIKVIKRQESLKDVFTTYTL